MRSALIAACIAVRSALVATCFAVCVAAIATGCGKDSTPTSPSSTSSSSTTTVTPPVTNTTPPTSSNVTSCASWAGQQKGSGVPQAVGSVVAQRDALYAAGGGLKAVGSKYYGAYFPSGFASSGKRRILIALHGTGGSPEAEFNDWHTTVDSRSWGFLGLKYLDDATGAYDDVQTIYSQIKAMVDDVKASCDTGSASFFLVGFSRGSAESFSLEYLDLKDRRLFKAIGNNSGAWPDSVSLPPTLAPVQTRSEMNAFTGSRFWMYCGEQDFEHGYSMCIEMQAANDFVVKYGGTVKQLYKDPTGTHGGLVRNADALSQMLSYFESL